MLAGCWVECVGPLSSCCDKLVGMCRLVTLLEVCFILGVLLGVGLVMVEGMSLGWEFHRHGHCCKD